MEHLPLVNRQFDDEQIYKCNLTELKNKIKEYVEADCWAIISDTEVLFNDFDKTRTHERIVLEDVIRKAIINNPSLLLIKKSKIRIFMFGNNTWTVDINYHCGIYKLSFFKK